MHVSQAATYSASTVDLAMVGSRRNAYETAPHI